MIFLDFKQKIERDSEILKVGANILGNLTSEGRFPRNFALLRQNFWEHRPLEKGGEFPGGGGEFPGEQISCDTGVFLSMKVSPCTTLVPHTPVNFSLL